MMQKIIRICFLAPLVLEIYSFSPSNGKLRRLPGALHMAYNTFVTVDSNFEAPCSLVADAGVSLSDYMQLPVEQYVCIKMPLDATLERMEGTKFNMTVPPVRFFTLDVSPTIICDVAQNDQFVTIESSDCTLRGSPYVVELNGCYRLKISATFSWSDSKTTIGLEVDPPAPFKYFGKSILETTGRLALSIALSEIGNAFVKALATDYEKWATSDTYRVERAGGLCHVDTEEEILAERLKLSGRAPSMAFSQPFSAAPSAPIPTSIPVPVSVPTLAVTSSLDADNSLILAAGMMSSDMTDEKEILLADVVTKNSLPVLTDDICLFPGSEPIVRVEEAPSNARRIFTGVDIMADMESIWDVLTAFDKLQDVVPSLVKNEVVFLTPEGGARLAQVGGAKVLPGVTFTAKTVLDVCVYLEDNPMPDDMLAESTVNGASSADVRAFGKALPLQRGVFPRPYSLTRLPHRDITMQNVPGEGDFEHYQGVWRMQALPNCAPDGSNASRLTYAVEIKPKGLLPVKLIEGRIAADLKSNMAAIRKFVEAAELKKPRRSPVLEAQTIPITTTDSAVGSGSTGGIENIIESESDEVEVLIPKDPLPLASASTGIALIEHAGGRKHGSKRRGLLRAISRLFGRGKAASVDGATYGGAEHSSADMSSSLIDPDDSTALLQENRRLKERVLFLEAEMAKASIVLRKIEELSKLD